MKYRRVNAAHSRIVLNPTKPARQNRKKKYYFDSGKSGF